MNKQKGLNWKDCLFLLGIVLFFFGCIATTHRSAKTMKPGQLSVSGSYLRANSIEEPSSEPIRLISLDSRLGLSKGVDIGIMHTWDITKDNDNSYATFWGDLKVQLTNRDNVIGQPILSIGLMKGYVYHENAKLHITTFPFMASIPINEYLTPYFIYRYEVIREDFIPNNLRDPRHTFVFGIETNLRKPSPDNTYMPKLGLSIGTFNSLYGGNLYGVECDEDQGLILNLGFSIDMQ